MKKEKELCTMRQLNRGHIYMKTGYQMMEYDYENLSLAENFGKKEVRKMYKTCKNNCGGDYKFLTELCVVLRILSKEDPDNRLGIDYRDLYKELFKELNDYCVSRFDEEAIKYFDDIMKRFADYSTTICFGPFPFGSLFG